MCVKIGKAQCAEQKHHLCKDTSAIYKFKAHTSFTEESSIRIIKNNKTTQGQIYGNEEISKSTKGQYPKNLKRKQVCNKT